ncbi:MAG: hypothetical protein ACREMQ_09280 [Longimicrobiales bacterium]
MTSRQRLLAGVVALSATVVSIQPNPAAARQTRNDTGALVETQFTERWLNSREKARFKPYASGMIAVRIDSVAASADGTRILHAALNNAMQTMAAAGRQCSGRARVTLDADGTVRGFDLELQRLQPVPGIDAAVAMLIARDWWFGGDHFGLPESMVWDVAPSFRPARLSAGVRWTDTLRFEAEQDGNRQSVRGVRVSMSNPAVALALGVPRDVAYENLRDILVRWPPAFDDVTPARACTPAACRMLASFADTAAEPRLRDLGLIARFALEPRAWAGEINRRGQAGSVMLQPAAALIRGVGRHQ